MVHFILMGLRTSWFIFRRSPTQILRSSQHTIRTSSRLSPLWQSHQPSSPAASHYNDDLAAPEQIASSKTAWKLVTSPFYIIPGDLGMVFGAVALGFWIFDGVLSLSLSILGFLLTPFLSGILRMVAVTLV